MAEVIISYEKLTCENLPKTAAEAKKQGIKRFFTGKSCKNGHIAERKACDGTCVVCARDINLKSINANPDTSKERMRLNNLRYYQLHTDKARQTSLNWRNRNIDVARDNCRKWRQNNPEKSAVHWRNRRARKRAAEGFHTDLDITRIRALQKDRCACCSVKLKGKGHVDHVIALSKGGSNWPRNIQLLCASCNMSKHNIDPISFMQSMGRLI